MAKKLTLAALLTLGGCGQILGLGDYDIDESLGAAGAATTDGGEGGETGGTANHAGAPNVAGAGNAAGAPSLAGAANSLGGAGAGNGGEPGTPQGGAPPVSGSSGEAGAAGSPHVGEVVPCDSADCCTELGGTAVGVELLKDGGFELGTPDTDSPWKEVSTTSSNELIIDDLSFGFEPKAGNWFVYLSGIKDEESTIYQTPVIPKDAGWLVVSGWRLFQVDSEDDTNADFALIGLYAFPSGDSVEVPFFWSAPPAQDGWGDTPTWKHFAYSFDAIPHQGLKREIDFRGSSDSYTTSATLKASSYLFDELSFKSFTCVK